MLPAFFGSDGSFPLQFAIIFLVIFAVLAVLVLLIRRFTGRGQAFANSGSRQRQPRLGIVDVYELDRQRQLILLRRDNVEHLLLVGGPNDVVVERNISRNSGARLPADEAAREEDTTEAVPDFVLPPPPLPNPVPAPAFPPREPASFDRKAVSPDFSVMRRGNDEPSSAERGPLDPPFAMPVAVPPPLPEAAPRMDRNDETVPPPVPPASRREPQPARILRRTPPPLVNPKPDVASERSRATDPQPPVAATVPAAAVAEPDFEAAFAAALAAPVTARMSAPAQPAMVPPPGPRTGTVDAGVLSDMARQLEEALRRPASGAKPSPTTNPVIPVVAPARDPAPPEQEPVSEPDPVLEATSHPSPEPVVPAADATETVEADLPSEQTVQTDPMAAGMASAADSPPDGDGLFEETAKPAEPELRPAPEQKPASPPPEPSKPEPHPASSNPFSVEEIEAEFARLLGRPLDRKN